MEILFPSGLCSGFQFPIDGALFMGRAINHVVILLSGLPRSAGLDGAFFPHKLRDRGKPDAVTVMGFLLAATIYHNNIRNGQAVAPEVGGPVVSIKRAVNISLTWSCRPAGPCRQAHSFPVHGQPCGLQFLIRPKRNRVLRASRHPDRWKRCRPVRRGRRCGPVFVPHHPAHRPRSGSA